MIINLSKNALKAAALCSAKDDVRYYLNGVCIDFIALDKIAYVSTDGHVMFAKVETPNWHADPQNGGFQFIIPNDIVSAAIKMASKHIDYITLESMDTGKYKLGSIEFAPIDGKFPDYHRVIPGKCTDELCQFDPELLLIAHKALNAERGSKNGVFPLYHNGKKGASVMSNSRERDAIVLIMPYGNRAWDEERNLGYWALDFNPHHAEQKAA